MRVAVIGGGVVGVCTAYYLAEAGHEVAVIERYGNVAQEASFGNLDLMGPASVRPCRLFPWWCWRKSAAASRAGDPC